MNTNRDYEPRSFTRHHLGGDIPTAHGIGKWLMEAAQTEATHLIVVCDTFDYDHYPVKVMPDENVHEVQARYAAKPMQKVVEVYWLDGDLNEQHAKESCFTYGHV